MSETPKILTAEFLRGLKFQDTFETEGFFQGVSKAPCKWRFTDQQKGGTYNFSVTYMGVKVASYIATILANGQVEIQEY